TFLALSYFGTDQSQVQRYLSGKSVRQSQMGMIFNGLVKVPMQFFILLTGIMVFVFYQFNSTPLNFNPLVEDAGNQSEVYRDLKNQLSENQQKKAEASLAFAAAGSPEEKNSLKEQIQLYDQKETELRQSGSQLISQENPHLETNDRDYVFIHFILNNLPRGLIGLLLAVILS